MPLYEADGFCTALVAYPKAADQRFAFVMECEAANVKLYFFVTRDHVMEIVESMVEMVGLDA